MSHYYGNPYRYGYPYGPYPYNTYRRHSTRRVYGSGVPCFNVKVGEIIDVLVSIADEVQAFAPVAAATPVATFLSDPAGSTASSGGLVLSTEAPEGDHIDILVNAQDTNLAAGELWQVDVQVQLEDGRTFVRSFKIKVSSTTENFFTANAATTTTTTTTTTDEPGVIISGGGQTLPTNAAAGTFYLTPPAGANWAQVQFLTAGAYTFDGSVPDDVNGIGFQVAAGTVVVLESADQIANFRFNGLNSGADAVQLRAEYWTGDPSP